MRHISVEQHLYISKVVMLCMGTINEAEKKAHKDGEFFKNREQILFRK